DVCSSDLNVGMASHQRIVGKTVVFQGVLDHENIRPQDGVAAKGNVSRGFLDPQAITGFEPLTVFVDQRNECNGNVKQLRCQAGNPVKPLLDRKSTRLNSSHVKISYAV